MSASVYCPLTHITMPVFGRPDETLETIAALRRNTRQPIVFTVVDNGNEPGFSRELERLADAGQIDHLFILDRNYGVSPACNVGWQLVDAPFFMKLDNDTKILSLDWLSNIYGMWGAARYSTLMGPVWHCRKERGSTQTPYGTLWKLPVSFGGTAFFVGKKISDQLGFFSEDYGLYGEEDADYCLRCHHAGIRKYSFEAENVLELTDQHDSASSYEAIKQQAHEGNVGTGSGRGIFALNVFLYEHSLRSVRVPLRYAIRAVQGRHVELVERSDYPARWDKLQQCLELFDQSGRAPTPECIEAMRRILGSDI